MLKRSLISIAALTAISGFAFAAEPTGKSDGPVTTPGTTNAPKPGAAGAGGSPAKEPAERIAPAKESGKAMEKSKPGDAAETGDKTDSKNPEMKSGEAKSDAKKADDMKSDSKSSENKDNAGSKSGDKGSKVSLSSVTPDQKSKVKTVFTKHRVEPAKFSISVNVGVAVPRETHLYSVPDDIIVIAPAYRDYRYFLIGDKICIVDPDTFEIVDIIIIA